MPEHTASTPESIAHEWALGQVRAMGIDPALVTDFSIDPYMMTLTLRLPASVLNTPQGER